MEIECYAIMYNEAERLPWYLDHYSFADRIYLYDNHSTDDSVAIAKRDHRVEVWEFGKGGASNQEFLDVKNNCWKDSEADWVIVGDIDEHLHHPRLSHYLQNTPATILKPAHGWEMVSADFMDYRQVLMGYNSPGHQKVMCFKPSEIDEINYDAGCHVCHPSGNLVWDSPEELVVYHYQFIGKQNVLARYHQNRERRCAIDKKLGWSVQYEYSDKKILSKFDDIDLAKKVK